MTDIYKKPDDYSVSDPGQPTPNLSAAMKIRALIFPIGLSLIFLVCVAAFASSSFTGLGEETVLIAIAAVIGAYMAINIGANDVANNMGPAVGGKVLTVFAAIIIAVICETAGALLAGGDVVQTVSKGIITPGESLSIADFRTLMVSALLAAALWINLATILNAPVSTTHSIVGGVLGSGIAAAGLGLVNWATMSKIAASWVISPVFGALVSALLLLFIKVKIFDKQDKVTAAKNWVPILIGLMAAAFAAYMAMKGLKKIWKPSVIEITLFSLLAFGGAYYASKPYIIKRLAGMKNDIKSINSLFNIPLIAGAALLSFAHGANDVANAVGPLTAIVSTIGEGSEIASKVTIPLWIMVIGAFGIALGLGLFGPKLITLVGEKITRLNSPRAYCVALSSAITVLIATTLGLPVSSTHIAVGAVFGIGFLREFTEDPNRRKHRSNAQATTKAAETAPANTVRRKRRLVRRRFVVSIAAAWVITVPASALLSAVIYNVIKLL